MGLFAKHDHHHSDPRVRLEAIGTLDDERELVEVACTDDSPRVRMAAVERLTSDAALAEVAKDAAEIDVRLAAVERIGSEPVIAGILKARKNYQLMGACFARITDRAVLESIAQDPGYNPTARRMAVEQFADESYLTDLAPAGAGGDEDGAGLDEATIAALLEQYGDVRVVRAVGRFRRSEKALRALGVVARRGGEAGGLAVEYLCRALASSNPSVRECAADQLSGLADPELVAQLIRALDEPKLHAPIRDILRRIDTPEARAALG
ncbi:MAG: hypothetical protein PVF43_00110 [Candidatus Eiseniibacteriota bacterium]|jgi:hypothetical protein